MFVFKHDDQWAGSQIECMANLARKRVGALKEIKKVAETEADLQVLLASTEWRMYFSRARLGSSHYLVMQAQTAFPEAI